MSEEQDQTQKTKVQLCAAIVELQAEVARLREVIRHAAGHVLRDDPFGAAALIMAEAEALTPSERLPPSERTFDDGVPF